MPDSRHAHPAGESGSKQYKKSGRLKRVRQLSLLSGWFGWCDTIRFIAGELFATRRVRTVEVAGETVQLRTATADAMVATKILIDEEYRLAECESPEVIVDAGANIGMSAIYFARKYPQARVFAIEPEAENFELLKANTASFGNVIPVRAALWSRRETRTLLSRPSDTVGFTVSEAQGEAGATDQRVECITMESLMQQHDIRRIDILKMDIEGGEKEVLGHSEAWIGSVRVIAAELHDRICMGCIRAFYLATKDFARFEKHGAVITAFRQ